MKKTFKIAFCSVFSATSVCMLLLTTLVPVANYSLVALAGMMFIPLVIEIDAKYAFLSFIVSSLLSFLIVPDKQNVVLFIALGGYYPILKNVIERKIANKVVQVVVKVILFNVICIMLFLFLKEFLMIKEESLTIMGVYLPWVFLLLGNVVFLLYDFAMSKLILLYMLKFHDKIKSAFKL